MTTPTPLTGIEAMTVMYQEEYELRVQKEKELAAALDLQAAYFARCEQLRDDLAAAQDNRQYTCEAHRDEVKKGGRCVWCDLNVAHEELNTQAHELERLLNELAAAQEELVKVKAENSKLRSALELVHFKQEPWQ